MTSFVLPHEAHGDDPRRVFAVHGRLADRSARAVVLPDLGRTALSCAPADPRGHGEAQNAMGAHPTAGASEAVGDPAGRRGGERFSVSVLAAGSTAARGARAATGGKEPA